MSRNTQSVANNTAPRSVLLAEDDGAMRALLAEALRSHGYAVTECSDGGQLLIHLNPLIEKCGPVEFDAIVSDIRMPGITGLEIMEGITCRDECPPVVLITAFGDRETHEAAQHCGVLATLDKPFEIGQLLSILDGIEHRA